MINFLHVVLNGYINERKYFLDYLLREQKKAEAEHYQAEEFFSKCFDVVEGFKQDLDRQLNERKRELYLMLGEAKNETINYGQESELSYKERCKETKEYCQKELKEISRHNFTVLLHSYTKTAFTGHLHYDHVLEIETKIASANEAYNSEINLEEVLRKYKRSPEANLIPPYRLLFYKFDNWEKFLRFLKASTPRYFYVFGNLPTEDQIRLKNDFCDYLKEIREAQTESKYKEYLDNYINLIEEKYQEIKKEVPLYNPEGKRQLYEETKKVDVIFPFVPPQWKFNDWNKFLWFFEVTRPTYIYIFDRVKEHEQFQLKGDFTDYLNSIIEKQTETKYIKALEGFRAHISNYAGPFVKGDSKESENENLPKKADEDKIWFKVGILFATGEIDRLMKLFSNNGTRIAKEVNKDKWQSYRPYITESLSRLNRTDKNIFSDKVKIDKIKKYCEENNLPVISSFQAN